MTTIVDVGLALAPFEGREVLSVGIEIPDAAGGLREPLKVDPVQLEIDQEVHVVLKLRCKRVRFDEIKDTDALNRTHVMTTVEATFIDREAVQAALAHQRARIEQARDQQPLPFEPTEVATNGHVTEG